MMRARIVIVLLAIFGPLLSLCLAPAASAAPTTVQTVQFTSVANGYTITATVVAVKATSVDIRVTLTNPPFKPVIAWAVADGNPSTAAYGGIVSAAEPTATLHIPDLSPRTVHSITVSAQTEAETSVYPSGDLVVTTSKPSRDPDNDGVRKGRDKCPKTPAGVVVDNHGCP